jgi:hypothetical protein
VLSAWAWADVPGRGRVWVCAVVRDGDDLRLPMSAAERRAAGLTGPLTGELVAADGQRWAATATADGQLEVAASPRVDPNVLAQGARFEWASPSVAGRRPT